MRGKCTSMLWLCGPQLHWDKVCTQGQMRIIESDIQGFYSKNKGVCPATKRLADIEAKRWPYPSSSAGSGHDKTNHIPYQGNNDKHIPRKDVVGIYTKIFFHTKNTGLTYSTLGSVQFSCSVVSNYLRLHGMQHTSLPCLSLTPEACSNSCPSSWWCHLILCHPLLLLPSISCSIRVFSVWWVSSLHRVAKVLELQLQHHCFQWIFRTDILWNWLVQPPCGPRDSQESPPVPQFKSDSSLALSLLYVPTLTSVHDYWKNYLTVRTFVGKVMSMVLTCCLGLS